MLTLEELQDVFSEMRIDYPKEEVYNSDEEIGEV